MSLNYVWGWVVGGGCSPNTAVCHPPGRGATTRQGREFEGRLAHREGEMEDTVAAQNSPQYIAVLAGEWEGNGDAELNFSFWQTGGGASGGGRSARGKGGAPQ